MESEISGIFRVKIFTKNIVRGSPGTQFMHMWVKAVLLAVFRNSQEKICDRVNIA